MVCNKGVPSLLVGVFFSLQATRRRSCVTPRWPRETTVRSDGREGRDEPTTVSTGLPGRRGCGAWPTSSPSPRRSLARFSAVRDDDGCFCAHMFISTVLILSLFRTDTVDCSFMPPVFIGNGVFVRRGRRVVCDGKLECFCFLRLCAVWSILPFFLCVFSRDLFFRTDDGTVRGAHAAGARGPCGV